MVGDDSSAVNLKILKSTLKAAELLGGKPPFNKFILFLLFLPIIFLVRKHVFIRTNYKGEQKLNNVVNNIKN